MQLRINFYFDHADTEVGIDTFLEIMSILFYLQYSRIFIRFTYLFL